MIKIKINNFREKGTREMTTESLLNFFIKTAKTNDIHGSVDKGYIKKVCYDNQLSIEELIGTLCCVALQYNQELTAEKDKKSVYIQRLDAVQKTLEQLEKSQSLSSYQVKNLQQKNGAPRAKKFNENKFKMCIEMGVDKDEIMKALSISESTYYRLLRAYKAKVNQQ